jgi:hypothetical protein
MLIDTSYMQEIRCSKFLQLVNPSGHITIEGFFFEHTSQSKLYSRNGASGVTASARKQIIKTTISRVDTEI